MKKKLIVLGFITLSLLISGCEENTNVQQRQNILDDGITMEFSYTSILGEEIVDELLSKIRMPIGSKDEDLFFKNKKITYKDIPNKDLLLIGAYNYSKEHPEETTITIEDMNKELSNIFVDELKIKHNSVKDSYCEETNLVLNGIIYDLIKPCQNSNGYYHTSIITADDVDGKAIEIAEKVAYIETNGNENIIYKEKNGKEIKRIDKNENIELNDLTGLSIIKYTFLKYNEKYYFYSSEKIG